MNLRAYIELARLSNAPTIISNVLVGAAIGGQSASVSPPWHVAVSMSLAILLLYISGMALNDALDAPADRHDRPERPIPSGRITLQHAYAFATLCMAGGIAIAALFGLPVAMFAGVLVVAIVLYNLLHKRFAGAVIFMGVCRGLVYLTAAAAVSWPLEWSIGLPLALALMLYIVFVTLIARDEAGRGAGSPFAVRLSIFLIAIALAPALFLVPQDWMVAGLAAIILIGWLVAAQRFLIDRPPRVKNAVMAMLAGICLVDAYYLALLNHPRLAVIAWACFVITMIAHRRVSGT